ncbi:hypothetical protein L596_009406 [Steinernema carpocapsae]|nr:hypothetical protein L596_009406 [Steinernema carpocapsae]
MATGLRKKFASHAAIVIPVIFEKFKEKKPTLREPLVECIDVVAQTIPFDNMADDLTAALGKPNPSIKAQTDLFLYRSLKNFTAATAPKKTLKQIAPLIVKHTGESDPEVREASYQALGALMKAVGEKAALVFISEIAEDKIKMGKITEYRDKAAAEAAAAEAAKAAESAPAQQSSSAAADDDEVSSAPPSAREAVKEPEIDPWDMHDPVDVLTKLPANFYEQLESKKWLGSKEALQAFIDIAQANPKFCPKANYGEIVAVAKKLLEKDANINVAAAAARCITAMATGLRKKFASHAAIVIPVIFEKFKEKKPTLREPLVECIDAVAQTIPFDNILTAALGKPNPSIKAQTDLFLYRSLKNFTDRCHGSQEDPEANRTFDCEAHGRIGP